MTNVSSMPLGRRKALEIIREVANEGGNSKRFISALNFEDSEMYFRVVSLKQAILCIEEGELVRDPKMDKYNNFECVLYRLCGGQDVYTTVVITNHESGEHNLIVTNVENRL